MLGAIVVLSIVFSFSISLTFFACAIVKSIWPKISKRSTSNMLAVSLLWACVFAIFVSTAVFFEIGERTHYKVACSNGSYNVYKHNGFTGYYLEENNEEISFHNSSCVFIEVKEQ